MVKEIAVISGKGGTGKTSLALCMIPYFDSCVIADCDVDAPDMNIILNQGVESSTDFVGFQRPVIDYDTCIDCGLCHTSCKFNAIDENIVVKNGLCEGCNVCKFVCPVDAITMHDYEVGKIFARKTPYGPMIDARLIPGEESSGKLVSEVRRLSKNVAKKEQKDFLIIDGSPGIACNVISTISGVQNAIIVTEPTESGLHDLKRVYELTKRFSLKVDVVINKFDINREKSKEINQYCTKNGLKVLLHIPFDRNMVDSISRLKIPSTENIPFFRSKEWNDFIQYLQN